MRSLLFVPGDAPDKMQKALGSKADALILDLEDSVSPANKAKARADAAEFLKDHAHARKIFARVNPLHASNGMTDLDLDAVMPHAPFGIMLPKTNGAPDVQWLGAKLATREAQHGLAINSTQIIAIATETPQAIFLAGSYKSCSSRLLGLTWGGEDLSAALGAKTNRDDKGLYTEPYKLARNVMLFGAAAAGVQAIDAVYPNFRDADGLKTEAEQAARDGFTAKMAIHPGQIDIINAAFTPSAEEIELSQNIIAAFKTAGDAGVINFNGQMLDAPHLTRAQKIIARAGNTKLSG